MKLLIYLSLGFTVFFCWSCKHIVSKTELLNYIQKPENGIHLVQEVNGVSVSVMYWPQELVALQSVQNIDTLNNKLWQERCNYYKQYCYLKLKLSTEKGELLHAYVQDKNKYSQLVNQLSFGMASKAFLISQPCDTLLYIDSYIPRYYGANSSTEIMLIYSNENERQNDLRIVLKDLGIGTGDMRFIIKKENLKRIPTLSIEAKERRKT